MPSNYYKEDYYIYICSVIIVVQHLHNYYIDTVNCMCSFCVFVEKDNNNQHSSRNNTNNTDMYHSTCSSEKPAQ